MSVKGTNSQLYSTSAPLDALAPTHPLLEIYQMYAEESLSVMHFEGSVPLISTNCRMDSVSKHGHSTFLAKAGMANNTTTIKLIMIFMISSSFKRLKKIAELPYSKAARLSIKTRNFPSLSYGRFGFISYQIN
jgi:hypothetical protein